MADSRAHSDPFSTPPRSSTHGRAGCATDVPPIPKLLASPPPWTEGAATAPNQRSPRAAKAAALASPPGSLSHRSTLPATGSSPPLPLLSPPPSVTSAAAAKSVETDLAELIAETLVETAQPSPQPSPSRAATAVAEGVMGGVATAVCDATCPGATDATVVTCCVGGGAGGVALNSDQAAMPSSSAHPLSARQWLRSGFAAAENEAGPHLDDNALEELDGDDVSRIGHAGSGDDEGLVLPTVPSLPTLPSRD